MRTIKSLVFILALLILVIGSLPAGAQTEGVTLEEILSIPTESGPILKLAWSPTGGRVAVAGSNMTASIWNLDSSTMEVGITGFGREVSEVAWSPDGSLMAAGDLAGNLVVWGIEENAARHTLAFEYEFIEALEFSPDGSLLAVGANRMDLSAGTPSAILIIDMATGETVTTLSGESLVSVSGITWKPSGDLLAAATPNGTILIWNTADWSFHDALAVAAVNSFGVNGFSAIDSTDSGLAAAHYDGNLYAWAEWTGDAFAVQGNGGFIENIAFSPDGAWLAAGTGSSLAPDEPTGLLLWSNQSGASYSYTTTIGVRTISWSPDSTLLAASGDDSVIHVFALSSPAAE
jgi:WD40 repeat protein